MKGAESFDRGLRQIASDYAWWLRWDQERAKAAAVRSQLTDVAAHAEALAKALEACSAQTATLLGAVLTERTNELGRDQVAVLRHLCEQLHLAAQESFGRTPARWVGSARKLTALKLRALFEEHGMPFKASASDEYGTASQAVSALMSLGSEVGDPMETGAARKLIEAAQD